MAKRQELSLQEKIEVLDKVKKQPPNSSQRELAVKSLKCQEALLLD